MAQQKSALVLLPPGAEEMEFVIAVDVLRRAGVAVTVASIDEAVTVKCSRNVVIVADTTLSKVAEAAFDAIVLPGGLAGTDALAASAAVGALLQRQQDADRWIAAICAAPVALRAHSIGLGKRITAYPSMASKLRDAYTFADDDSPVVLDGKLLTSRGPGTAFAFGLRLSELLMGAEKAKEVSAGMLL